MDTAALNIAVHAILTLHAQDARVVIVIIMVIALNAQVIVYHVLMTIAVPVKLDIHQMVMAAVNQILPALQGY